MEKKLHNFNKKCKLHLACSKKDLYRPIMNHIYFDKGSAIATNGHILAVLDIKECSDFTEEEIEKLDGKLIHGKKFEELLKYDNVLINDEGFYVPYGDEDKLELKFSKNLGKYVEYDLLFAEHKNSDIYSIGLDMELISTLQKILPYRAIKITFGVDAKSAIVVTDANGIYKSKAIIMPYLTSEQKK